MRMTTSSVLDILIYVFDRYMLEDTLEVPEREDLARDLELMGFGSASVERALDWLADLADVRLQSAEEPRRGTPSLRLYSDGELTRLSTESRGFLMDLERHDILAPCSGKSFWIGSWPWIRRNWISNRSNGSCSWCSRANPARNRHLPAWRTSWLIPRGIRRTSKWRQDSTLTIINPRPGPRFFV